MGKRDVDDFPFAYLADQQSEVRGKRPDTATRAGSAQRRRNSAEIERLLIISVVLTLVFVILLVAAIVIGNEGKNKDRVNAATSITTAMTGETTQNGSSNITTTAPVAETQQTQVAVIQLE
ncbi:MAG: hypothetical protein GX099_04010 [Clostridiaceae bacterium]|jgi:hypothetical protein|nr:hypothetical protein [Oscillospiraceae bacterium]NLO62579.1 hypothetical protein [Clostridiaceae bacterium]